MKTGISARRLVLAVAVAPALFVAAATSAAEVQQATGASAHIFRDGAEEYLDLSGYAGFLEPLAGAGVTVSSQGGRTVQGAADGAGGFLLRYELVGPGTPLEVRVRGVDAQSEQEYAAWLGDPPFLLARAGADRVLDQAELPALAVNAFQTGRYLAISALPVSEYTPAGREAERLAASYNWLDAYYRSAMVALLVNGALEFPVGADTTLDAVSILSVAQPLYDTYSSTSYDPALLYPIGSDPQHVPMLDTLPFGRTLHTYSTFSPQGSPMGGTRVRLELDGTGSFASAEIDEQPVVWETAPEGYVRLTAAGGGSLAVISYYPYYTDCSCQRLAELHSLAVRMVFAEGPRGSLLLAFTLEQERRFPEEPARAPEPLTSYRPNYLETAIVDDIGLAAFDDPAGDVLWLQVGIEQFEGIAPQAEPHQFDADGTGLALHRSLAFTWEVDSEGRLLIEYGNGSGSTTVRASADREYGSTAVLYRTTLGTVRADGGIYVQQQPEADFAQFDPAGRTFLSQVNCDRPFATLEDYCRGDFGFTFAPDHTGNMAGSSSPLDWEVGSSGELLIRRYDPDGSLSQSREWTLVNRGASSVLVFERILLPDGYESAARMVRYVF